VNPIRAESSGAARTPFSSHLILFLAASVHLAEVAVIAASVLNPRRNLKCRNFLIFMVIFVSPCWGEEAKRKGLMSSGWTWWFGIAWAGVPCRTTAVALTGESCVATLAGAARSDGTAGCVLGQGGGG